MATPRHAFAAAAAAVTVLVLLVQPALGFEEPIELDFPQPDGRKVLQPEDAQTRPSIQDKAEETINVKEQEAIASIEKAELFLQRAEAAHVNAGKCTSHINAGIAMLGLAETYVLENDYASAGNHLIVSFILTQQALSHMQDGTKPLVALMATGLSEEQATFQPETTSFGSGVIGGAKGKSYVVTTPDDNPIKPTPGSLRYGVGLGGDDKGGVWITFAKSMKIVLQEMLWIRSYTTIDGRNVNATINGKALVLAGVSNVILHNFQINTVPDSDTVHIFAGTQKVWVDHLTSFTAKLGLVSVVQGSTDVTISNCYLTNQNFNMLLGASDTDVQDQIMRVTVYRNWFKESMQRMPHCRWGYCHVINNLYTDWGYYAIGARAHGKIKSEANVFISSRRPEVTPWFQGLGSDFDMTPIIDSSGDLLLNGSTFHEFLQFGPAIAPQYRSTVYYPPKRATTSLAMLVQRCAGALFGTALAKCLAAA